MSSSKRLVIVIALIGLNLLFTIKGLLIATKDIESLGFDSPRILGESIIVLDGAVLAKPTMPGKITATSEPKKVVQVVLTAYTSSHDETDDTPFVTASGSVVRPGVAASSFLPFGTKFRVPRLFGEKVFVVEDSMNLRYEGSKIVDLWFETKNDAQDFGKKMANIEII